MKALVYNATDKKADSFKLARMGLRNNVTSHICWHVLGLLYRGEGNYYESLLCYRNALYHDPKNERILKDLAQSQVHIRDFNGYFASRKKLLELRTDLRINWIGFALAAHLKGEHEFALSILSVFENATRKTKPMEKFETRHDLSEICLYGNYIMQDMGKYQEALEDLNRIDSTVKDRGEWQTMYGNVLLKLGKYQEAEAAYQLLLERNTECKDYHIGLQNAVLQGIDPASELTTEQKKKLVEVYDELKVKYPKSLAFEQFPLLSWVEGDQFKERFSAHVKPLLKKGVPSLFNGLKPLYKDASKVEIIENVLTNFYTNLKAEGKFELNDEKKELPSTLLWVLYFLAQHYNKLNNTVQALVYIEEAIEHTPTVVDLYVVHAKILKTSGKLLEAAEKMEYARTLDLADRYLNTKSTKYWLRADQLERAEQTIGIFTTQENTKFNNIYDMQVFWYEYEAGLYHLRQDNLGMALKKFTNIEKHFNVIVDDQYSYHNYCIRMTTMRAYLKLLRLEDNLFGHKFYTRAAQRLALIYIKLHNSPSQKEIEAKEMEGMDENEKQSYITKKRKEKRAKMEALASESKKKSWNGKVDTDPWGDKLKEASNPLELALKYAKDLSLYSSKDPETQKVLYQVYMVSSKPLLALKAIKKLAQLIGKENDVVKEYLVEFTKSFESLQSGKSEVVKSFVNKEISDLK